MADIDILKAGQWRLFVQDDGPGAANPYNYVGCLSLGGITQELGEGTPVYCPSSQQANAWDIVDIVESVPGLPTTDFTQHADRLLRDFWFTIRRKKCEFHMQAYVISCSRPDDPNDWDAKIHLFLTRLTTFSMAEMNPLSGDANSAFDLTGSLQMQDFEAIYPIKWAEVGESAVFAEAIDVFYYDVIQCGDCGAPSDGCQKVYWLTKASGGSPGLSGQIAYSLNGGSTVAIVDIPTLGGADPQRFAPMGNRVVVLEASTTSHHTNLISTIDAGLTTGWSEVTGYTTNPLCIWVKNSSEAYIGGASGYIYKLTNPTLAPTVLSDGSITAQDLNDIDGLGNTIVAVGDSNAAVISENGGESFAALTLPSAKAAVNAVSVSVNGPNSFWVAWADGDLYFTVDGGTTWTESVIDSSIDSAQHVTFYNEVIGYFACKVGTTPRTYRTSNGGYTWVNTTPEISALPSTVDQVNRLAPCGWNEVAFAGREASGGDGTIAIAS